MDVLGFKSILQKREIAKATIVQEYFVELVRDAIKQTAPISGGIFADSAALQFENVTEALIVGEKVMYRALSNPQKEGQTRVWLRGVIGDMANEDKFVISSELTVKNASLTVTKWSPPLLSAIASESCGFKGMRILVSPGAYSGLTGRLPIRLYDAVSIPLVRSLRHSIYPAYVKGWHDYLWMIDGTQQIEKVKGILDRRLRWAGDDPREFEQAAATYLVSTEIESLIRAAESAAKTKAERELAASTESLA